jgi:uncharacterized integral membrane protein
MIVGVGLALVKANAAADLVHHRTGLIVALAAALAVSVLRTRPVGIALSGAPLLAFALAPGSTALGIALGFGAFVLLLALFVAIGTVPRLDRLTIGQTCPDRSGRPRRHHAGWTAV